MEAAIAHSAPLECVLQHQTRTVIYWGYWTKTVVTSITVSLVIFHNHGDVICLSYLHLLENCHTPCPSPNCTRSAPTRQGNVIFP
jgi:hypothetical protein